MCSVTKPDPLIPVTPLIPVQVQGLVTTQEAELDTPKPVTPLIPVHIKSRFLFWPKAELL